MDFRWDATISFAHQNKHAVTILTFAKEAGDIYITNADEKNY